MKDKFSILDLLMVTVTIAMLTLLAVPLHAAQVNPFAPNITVATNLPAIVNATTSSNTTSYVSIRRNAGMSLTWKFNVSSGTSAGVVLLYPTGDGTNYATGAWTITGTATSTTDAILFTNWSQAQLSGIVGFKIGALTNANAGVLTNKLLLFTQPVVP